MRHIRSKNTVPELAVRKLVYSLGYRYRLHSKKLPGHPDLVFGSRKKAIFVHGCFWHAHTCSKGQPPKSRLDYWIPKLENNKKRDEKNVKKLEEMGWKVYVVWQCEIKNIKNLELELISFLNN